MQSDLNSDAEPFSGNGSNQVLPMASTRRLVSEIDTPRPITEVEEAARNRPVIDYGFSEDINRRIEINYDPNSARYPIPKYLKRITDTLFSRATAKEIFMVQMDNVSKQRSKKWKSKGKLNFIPPNQKVFKRALHSGGLGPTSMGNMREGKIDPRKQKVPREEVFNMDPAQFKQGKSSKQTVVLHRKSNTLKSGDKEHGRSESNRLEIDEPVQLQPPAVEQKTKKKDSIGENDDWVLSQCQDVSIRDRQLRAMSEDNSVDAEPSFNDIKSEKYSNLSKEVSINSLKKQNKPLAEKATPDKKSEDGKSTRCVVCCLREPDCVVMPCGHAGVCNFCSINIFDNNGKCPICRAVRLSNSFRISSRYFR